MIAALWVGFMLGFVVLWAFLVPEAPDRERIAELRAEALEMFQAGGLTNFQYLAVCEGLDELEREREAEDREQEREIRRVRA